MTTPQGGWKDQTLPKEAAASPTWLGDILAPKMAPDRAEEQRGGPADGRSGWAGA